MKLSQLVFDLAMHNAEALRIVTDNTSNESLIGNIASIARKHRVALPVVDALSSIPEDVKVPAVLKTYVDDVSALQQFYVDELNALRESGIVESGSVMIIKGSALQPSYTAPVRRQSNDIDLVASKEEDFWRLSRWITGRGYRLLGMPMAYPEEPTLGRWRYMFAYSKYLPGHTKKAKLELHLGISPVSLSGYYDLQPIIRRTQQLATNQPADPQEEPSFFLFPSSTDCLLILLVKASEARPLLLRDVLDFAMLAQSGLLSGSMWATVKHTIEDEGLVIQFLTLAGLYEKMSGVPFSPGLASDIATWQRRYPYWRFISRHPSIRYTGVCMLRPGGQIEALREMTRSLSDILLNTRLASMIGLGQPSPILRAGSIKKHSTSVSLLHLTNEYTGAVDSNTGPAGELLLRTPIGIFLVTRSSEFNEDVLQQILSNVPKRWSSTVPQG